ncbi:MAG: FtsW/RodA/SpoVE family cell cycle protein [Lactobacillales bacterium]|jgi:rod shape determining protein RodA|nr:FtsW/RodA/SpoVE family cell cycle protein [Lactobacillales bacterium]
MKKTRQKTFDSRLNYGVLMPVFVLILIGLLSLFVALKHSSYESVLEEMMAKQIAWTVIGIIAMIVVIHINLHVLWLLSIPSYLLGLGVMVLPLFFYNPTLVKATGAKNWVSIGSQTLFQPSELMKIAYILFLAYLIIRHNTKLSERKVTRDLFLIGKLLLATLPILMLLKLQNDFGTVLVFLAILCGMILLSGVSWKILFPGILAVLLLIGIFIFFITNDLGRQVLQKAHILQNYQLARIDAWLNPFHDATGKSYQQKQGLLAIGSGGLFGKGFDKTQLYVPVRESDMIFTVIGENFGFVGSTLVILLYFLLIYHMVKITLESNNQFYTYIATGLIMMILFHVFENIGANIGLLPLTGIPLPFVSQGGSSMVGNLLGTGLVLSMYYHQKKDNYRQLQRRSI